MLKDELEAIEFQVVQGSSREARRLLKLLDKKKIPRSKMAYVAQLARRALKPLLSIRLLYPIVAPASKLKATPEEIAEYAIALSEIGVHHEAKRLLGTLEKSDAAFFLGYVHARLWEFSESRDNFELYLQDPEGNPLGRRRARLEMAYSLVLRGVELDRAVREIEDVLSEVAPTKMRIIYKNALTYLARALVLQGETDRARRILIDVGELARQDNDLGLVHSSTEWLMLANLRDGREVRQSVRQLISLKNEAPGYKHWETNRRIDFYRALLTEDRALLTRLYFGTAYPNMKKRIAALLGDVPTEFEWILYPESSVSQEPLKKGVPVQHLLKAGSAGQRLLNVFVSDLYRPMNVGALHDLIHPGEFFNPLSSPGRIHQAVKRLNLQLEEQRAVVRVGEKDGFYFLRPTGQRPVTLLLKDSEFVMDAPEVQRLTAFVEKLAQHFKGEFSATEAAKAVQASYRSTIRYLNLACEEGRVVKLRSGLRISYKVLLPTQG